MTVTSLPDVCTTPRAMTVASVVMLLMYIPYSAFAEPCVPDRYNTNASRVKGKLNIHLVPHTHDDSGWLKTMDQYYYGSNNKIQLAAVQYILDTVVQALDANPDRKFVYGEMSFFTRWWREQTAATKDLVRKLVDNGQLDFVNGGYVQHDEAAAHYVAMIDQTTRGHSFLKEQFGKVPTIGWQLDPFGHSATHASLMCGLLGFDALFFGRADYQDMEVRKAAKQMEVLWRGAKSFGDSADVFTANFPTGNYGAPGGFWYDPWSPDDPIMDDKCLYDYNVQNRVDAFVNASQELASVTYGDDVLIPFGSDFQWISAHQYYKNVDKLIHYINKDGRINAFYSTPADYVAVKHHYNHSWPLKTDDFFPYADCPVCYWTGYFTSRATSKGWIREATSYLQAARQLEVLTGAAAPTDRTTAQLQGRANTDSLEEAVSLLQHHDAITGTEKQHVANDYHARLARGWKESQKVFTDALAELITADSSAYKAAEADAHPLQAAGIRRMLANPQHHDSSYPAAQSASSSLQSNLNVASTAGTAHSLSSLANTHDTAEAAKHNHTSSNGHTSLAEDSARVTSTQIASQFDTCPADDAVSTVCVDRDQPVLTPQPWEEVDQVPGHGLKLQQCQLLNASVCEPSVQMSKQGRGFLVAVYNALGWDRASEPIRVPLDVTAASAAMWVVTDPDGKAVESQLVPVSQSTRELQGLMAKEGLLPGLDNAAQHELVFLARLPPVGYAVYTVTPHSKAQAALLEPAAAAAATHTYTYSNGVLTDTSAEAEAVTEGDCVSLDNGLLQLNFSKSSGRLISLANHQAGVATNLTLDMAAYLSGDQNAGGQHGPPSSAYIFRPDGMSVPEGLLQLHVARGPVLTEVHQVFLDYTSAVIRLWDKALHVEVEWTVGPTPIEDKHGKEVVLRYASSLDSGQTYSCMCGNLPDWCCLFAQLVICFQPPGAAFYTDANGREYLKRTRNFRPAWNLTVTEPEAGNYYPLTAGAYIQDASRTELAVLTDRAQGGASLASGQLEVMLHRRTLFDDWRGVGEPLNETMQGCTNCASAGLIARGRHWLTLQDPKSAALVRRTFQQRLNDPPILSFGPLPKQAAGGLLHESGLALQFSALRAALPFNVHLLTLKALPNNSVLLRLAHLYQVDEHGDLAQPAEVMLRDMFDSWKLSTVSELSLSANQLQSDIRRLKWHPGKSLSGETHEEMPLFEHQAAVRCHGQQCLDSLKIVLNPMEIRTFLLELA
ncbi:hypothetical protein ABBQ38_003541 [Trebouxia sp. C0009 RCD-2024]